MANHCGTCKHAKEFHYSPDGPSGPEDGVYCDSEDLAIEIDDILDVTFDISMVKELQDTGYIHVWRTELMLDDETDCTHWEASMKHQLSLVICAMNGLLELWDEDQVKQYPSYLPSFDEFVVDFSHMMDEPD